MAEVKLVEGPGWNNQPTKMPVGSHCNLSQYQLLKECSEQKNIDPWNQYREECLDQEVILQGADLRKTHLEHADLRRAHLEHANLRFAHLEHTDLFGVHLEHAELMRAHLEHANLWNAHLESADLWEAHLEHADPMGAHLEHADLMKAHLEHANLQEARLEHANLWEARLEGASFQNAIVQNAVFSGKFIDTKTDFTGSNISEARICPELEAQLEYNIRRKYWKKWIRGEDISGRFRILKLILRRFVSGPVVSAFWWATDYGTNSIRLLIVFAVLALFFAMIYSCSPDLVRLSCGGGLRSFWHALYFSVVTMTTLGFGDIHANPDNWVGQGVLMFQVFLGYILLGAFITRFGIMFMSKAPCPYVPRADEDKWDYQFRRAWKWIRRVLTVHKNTRP